MVEKDPILRVQEIEIGNLSNVGFDGSMFIDRRNLVPSFSYEIRIVGNSYEQ